MGVVGRVKTCWCGSRKIVVVAQIVEQILLVGFGLAVCLSKTLVLNLFVDKQTVQPNSTKRICSTICTTTTILRIPYCRQHLHHQTLVGGIIDGLGFCSPYISLVLTMAVSSGVVKRLLKDYYLYETI